MPATAENKRQREKMVEKQCSTFRKWCIQVVDWLAVEKAGMTAKPFCNNKELGKKTMKKFVTFCVLGAALALSACASQKGDSDYGYESHAPYASERTVGETGTADPVFRARQAK